MSYKPYSASSINSADETGDPVEPYCSESYLRITIWLIFLNGNLHCESNKMTVNNELAEDSSKDFASGKIEV